MNKLPDNFDWNNYLLLNTDLKFTTEEQSNSHYLGYGINENRIYKFDWIKYIKENNIWKFKKMHFYLVFRTPLDEGWVKTPVVLSMAKGSADLPATVYKPYPSGYVIPFHFKNPVTGK